MFTCPVCNKPMIWAGDNDYRDGDDRPYIGSHHHCNDCDTTIEYGQPVNEEE